VLAGDTPVLVHNCGDGIDDAIFNAIDDAHGPGVATGVDYNFQRMCPVCNPANVAADHSIAGIGNNARALGDYLASFGDDAFTHVDPRSGANVLYDISRTDAAGRGVVVVRNSYMTHAYHLSQDVFDSLYQLAR
jgi:hypothetical protein